jgi:hypothetical protein
MPTARNQLKASLSQIFQVWNETRERWDDPASRGFEKDFLLTLEPPAKAALTAMEEMGELLSKARRECE